jgi:hypothetical protein
MPTEIENAEKFVLSITYRDIDEGINKLNEGVNKSVK